MFSTCQPVDGPQCSQLRELEEHDGSCLASTCYRDLHLLMEACDHMKYECYSERERAPSVAMRTGYDRVNGEGTTEHLRSYSSSSHDDEDGIGIVHIVTKES
ncbi:hypothetical protein NHX12_006486 [Muraenolepis orangiensis]|uniref:Uncharacterized protein n=1 Tax=Muraenolepis orangiensis TaxID=630683 RepID=A0A9Q0DR40_9TELE|nr:hypothetical protein NHX12_006486 [Muraenolepis orangiensis]